MSEKWDPDACFPHTIYSIPIVLFSGVCVCVGSLQVRYNLGGLRAPFTIDVDQRNLANGQPHSFNLSRVDRSVTIQVRKHTLSWTAASSFPFACFVSIPPTHTHTPSPSPSPAHGRPGSRSVICILVPQSVLFCRLPCCPLPPLIDSQLKARV